MDSATAPLRIDNGKPLSEVIEVADAVHARMMRILSVPYEKMHGQIRLELAELEGHKRRLERELVNARERVAEMAAADELKVIKLPATSFGVGVTT